MLLALREIRQSVRLTQADLARATGVSLQAIKNIEAGKASPTLATAARLLRPFGYTVGVIPSPRA